MNGYRISRTDSVPAAQRSSVAASLERMKRHTDSVERSFADVSPKPETVYNVRMKRTLPIHERHFRELSAQIKRGANVMEVIAGGHGMLSDLAARHAEIPRIGLDDLHQAEFEVEATAAPIQLRARLTRSVEDLRAAIEWTDKEIASLMGLRHGYVELLDQKVMLEADHSTMRA